MPYVEDDETTYNEYISIVQYKRVGQCTGLRPFPHWRVKLRGIVIDIKARSEHKCREMAHDMVTLYGPDNYSSDNH